MRDHQPSKSDQPVTPDSLAGTTCHQCGYVYPPNQTITTQPAQKWLHHAETNLNSANPADMQAVQWAKALALASIASSLIEITERLGEKV